MQDSLECWNFPFVWAYLYQMVIYFVLRSSPANSSNRPQSVQQIRKLKAKPEKRKETETRTCPSCCKLFNCLIIFWFGRRFSIFVSTDFCTLRTIDRTVFVAICFRGFIYCAAEKLSDRVSVSNCVLVSWRVIIINRPNVYMRVCVCAGDVECVIVL